MNNRIEINPKVIVGKPVIKGTRLTVEYILELIEEGNTFEKILAEHPRLTKKDLINLVEFA